jgi:HAAS
MMSATTGLPANVEVYLAELRAELADLAADERDDLLAEVEASLLESAGDEPLAAQFGPPAAFAADLRASAGLPPKPVAKPPRAPRVDWRAVLERTRVLAPIWWALRGYVAVAGLAWFANAKFSVRQPAIPWFGSAQAGVVAIAAGVLISVALGLFVRVPRPFAVAGNAILVLALIPVVAHLASPERIPVQSDASLVQQIEATRYEQANQGLSYNGESVKNIYPYDRRGHLLHDVRLYGDGGRPLDVGRLGGDLTRRPVLTADGEALNAFPIRYYEPGTNRVANPDAGPAVDAKPLTTSPLK